MTEEAVKKKRVRSQKRPSERDSVDKNGLVDKDGSNHGNQNAKRKYRRKSKDKQDKTVTTKPKSSVTLFHFSPTSIPRKRCSYMECGRKFEKEELLKDHVTIIHELDWQEYIRYYHRPDVDTSKKHHVKTSENKHSKKDLKESCKTPPNPGHQGTEVTIPNNSSSNVTQESSDSCTDGASIQIGSVFSLKENGNPATSFLNGIFAPTTVSSSVAQEPATSFQNVDIVHVPSPVLSSLAQNKVITNSAYLPLTEKINVLKSNGDGQSALSYSRLVSAGKTYIYNPVNNDFVESQNSQNCNSGEQTIDKASDNQNSSPSYPLKTNAVHMKKNDPVISSSTPKIDEPQVVLPDQASGHRSGMTVQNHSKKTITSGKNNQILPSVPLAGQTQFPSGDRLSQRQAAGLSITSQAYETSGGMVSRNGNDFSTTPLYGEPQVLSTVQYDIQQLQSMVSKATNGRTCVINNRDFVTRINLPCEEISPHDRQTEDHGDGDVSSSEVICISDDSDESDDDVVICENPDEQTPHERIITPAENVTSSPERTSIVNERLVMQASPETADLQLPNAAISSENPRISVLNKNMDEQVLPQFTDIPQSDATSSPRRTSLMNEKPDEQDSPQSVSTPPPYVFSSPERTSGVDEMPDQQANPQFIRQPLPNGFNSPMMTTSTVPDTCIQKERMIQCDQIQKKGQADHRCLSKNIKRKYCNLFERMRFFSQYFRIDYPNTHLQYAPLFHQKLFCHKNSENEREHSQQNHTQEKLEPVDTETVKDLAYQNTEEHSDPLLVTEPSVEDCIDSEHGNFVPLEIDLDLDLETETDSELETKNSSTFIVDPELQQDGGDSKPRTLVGMKIFERKQFMSYLQSMDEGSFYPCALCEKSYRASRSYMWHLFLEHCMYKCALCQKQRPQGSNLYRFLETIKEHEVVEHGLSSEECNNILTCYKGHDLNIDIIDEVDNVVHVTADKVLFSTGQVLEYSLSIEQVPTQDGSIAETTFVNVIPQE